MKIGIIVFAYNRSLHLSKVFEGLKKNAEIGTLYVFQDGLKCEGHREEWEKTKKVIEEFSWCSKKYYLSENNKGLAASIIFGINTVLEENDAFIALEDDCVPAPSFCNFMKQCFEKYKDNEQIYSVSGYSWPIDNKEEQGSDIFFCGRSCSWGWGTWKDRWQKYSKDAQIIERLKSSQEKSRDLACWGCDLEQMVYDAIQGKNNSWAVYWSLLIIEKNGICINPIQSLIQNIGMDGSGVHCGVSKRFDVGVMSGNKEKFLLPDKVEVRKEIIEAFAELYGSYCVISLENEDLENVHIYGTGYFYRQNEREILQEYNIQAFIDKNKKGWFAGKKIIPLEQINPCSINKIIIMVQDLQEDTNITKELILKYKVPYHKIIWGNVLYGSYSECIKRIIISDNADVEIESEDGCEWVK